jgi:hypothetical protein
MTSRKPRVGSDCSKDFQWFFLSLLFNKLKSIYTLSCFTATLDRSLRGLFYLWGPVKLSFVIQFFFLLFLFPKEIRGTCHYSLPCYDLKLDLQLITINQGTFYIPCKRIHSILFVFVMDLSSISHHIRESHKIIFYRAHAVNISFHMLWGTLR